jgi:transcriptional regulator with XRE-family HTH domain
MPPKNADNAAIAQRIRAARKAAGLTQEDLSKYLRRTSAAISDLERGKVKISAVDVHKLAQLLKKPIEYFYGDDLGGDDIREFVYVLRQTPGQVRKQMLPGMKYSLRLIELGEMIKNTTDEQELLRLIGEYKTIMQTLAELSSGVNANMTSQNNEIQAKLAEILNTFAAQPSPEAKESKKSRAKKG